MDISKDILQKMDSATHYAKEVPLNMTQLSELLSTCGDTVFTVSFRKQPNEKNVCEKLKEATTDQLQDAKFVSTFSKEITEGEECTLVCYIVSAEGSLGRSTVIDLSSNHANKFRQVDHRSIISVILRNVKYVNKKGGKKLDKADESDDEMDGGKGKANEPKWDHKDLKVGNIFSGTSYYQVTSVSGEFVTTKCEGKDVTISKDILECQMYNAGVYGKEEKVSMTKVAQ